MRRSKILGGVSLAALMVLVAAGPALAKPLTERQWRRQANVICTQVGSEIGALDAELLEDYVQSTPDQVAAFVDRAVPVFEAAIAAVDALEEPKALRADVKRLVRAATKELDALRDDPSILTATQGDALPKTRKISEKLGLGCIQQSG
jgi:hypothetical protein